MTAYTMSSNTRIEEEETPSGSAPGQGSDAPTTPTVDRVGFLSEEGRNHLVSLLNAGSRVQHTGCLASIADGYEMAKAFKYFTDPAFDPADVPAIPEGSDQLQNCGKAPQKSLALIGVAIRTAIAGQSPKDHTSAYSISDVYPVVEAIRYFTLPPKSG